VRQQKAAGQERVWRWRTTGQHNANRQEHSARDFASRQGLENAGILCVFQVFQNAVLEQKIRRRPQTHLRCDAQKEKTARLLQQSDGAPRFGKHGR